MVFKTIARFSAKKVKTFEEREEDKTYIEEPAEKKPVFKTVWETVMERRDVKRYLPKNVPDNLIFDIIEAGSNAHSEGNSQPWEFIIIKNPDTKKAITEAAYKQAWIEEADIIIIACINTHISKSMYGVRGEKLYGTQAVAASIQNMLLVGESMGLGMNWIGEFHENSISTIVQCPEYIRPCAIITIGWPAEKEPKHAIQPLNDIVHIEKFGETLLTRAVLKEKTDL